MKNLRIFKDLHNKGFLSDASLQRVATYETNKKISLEWDIKTILYLGVTMLSTGLGILVYQNIDTIGHQAILAFIALISISCFWYCFKLAPAFLWGKATSPNLLFDYLLLLGCLTMLVFIAYLQYQYNVFGNKYGIATFIPMVILFFAAYYFDHLGVLSLAITNFAAWFGLTITPLRLWQSNNFNSSRIIFTAICIGILLMLCAYLAKKRNLKAHFEFTYNNFGTNCLLFSLLAAMFHFQSIYFIWFLVFMAVAVFIYLKAMRDQSFYFLMITVLYSYVAISYIVIRLLEMNEINELQLSLGLLYFIGSAIAMVYFLIMSNKQFKQNDSL